MWELDHKKNWAPKNWCFSTVALEKTLESPLDCKEIKPVNLKGNQSWIYQSWSSNTLATWCKQLIIGNNTEAGKDWRQEKKGTIRGWGGWMASPTRWTWVWASFGSWWWTGKPGMLQSMGLQRTGLDWLNWITTCCSPRYLFMHAFAKNLLLYTRCYMTIKPTSIYCHWLCDRHCTRHWREIVNKTVSWRN